MNFRYFCAARPESDAGSARTLLNEGVDWQVFVELGSVRDWDMEWIRCHGSRFPQFDSR
jgi:hypothetical protein